MYHKLVEEMSFDRQPEYDGEDPAIAKTEVEFVEKAVTSVAERITGETTIPVELWQPAQEYIRRFERKLTQEIKEPKHYWKQEAEHFRIMRLWINQTETYLAYLEAFTGVPDSPSPASVLSQPRQQNNGVAYDVAISFAGADRSVAAEIAEKVKAQ